jgi:hypothetical protein
MNGHEPRSNGERPYNFSDEYTPSVIMELFTAYMEYRREKRAERRDTKITPSMRIVVIIAINHLNVLYIFPRA